MANAVAKVRRATRGSARKSFNVGKSRGELARTLKAQRQIIRKIAPTTKGTRTIATFPAGVNRRKTRLNVRNLKNLKLSTGRAKPFTNR